MTVEATYWVQAAADWRCARLNTYSYTDAVKLMGAKEHKLVSALDKLLGGALLAGSALDLFGLLGWFDAKAEFVRLSHEYAIKLSEKRSGISRFDRTQRLCAAHTMIVLCSLFEALDESGMPVVAADLMLTYEEPLPKVPQQLADLISFEVPLVRPELSYEDNLRILKIYYGELTKALGEFLTSLSVWDDMDERERGILTVLPEKASRRYEENIRRLATECPEFGLWLSLQTQRGTQAEIRKVGKALADMGDLLSGIAVGVDSLRRRVELAALYRSILDLPIIEPDQVPDGINIPIFRECYIDPRFQVGNPTLPAQMHSWGGYDIRSDAHEFFAGYLTSPGAITAPLLVLGDPGSGKSVLTKVLAARLPDKDFVPLRVELRTTPTEADLVQQLEYGIEVALQEHVSWAEWTRSADGALPVVFLDGFDELLQATGVSQTSYLKRVQRLQRDSAALGRPVAVVVTSRISVADKAAIPEGSTVMRLVPFDSDQTERWLDAWNSANESYYSGELVPLDLKTVLSYPDLAGQPLLLLMLAIYDADGNALRRNSDSIGQAELYERLLVRFARREIVKDEEDRCDEQMQAEVEEELERLSVVALAMFNRGVQWITEYDLDRDLVALLGGEPKRTGVRTPLGAGEEVLGRFFFIQRAQALRDETTLRTYEFLHATFGEYLVARITWRTIRDLLQVEQAASSRIARMRALDDANLYNILSFELLTSRLPIGAFVLEIANADPLLDDLAKLLVRTFQEAHKHRPKSAYEPADMEMPARYAVYSANIMFLATIANGQLPVSRLLGVVNRVPDIWRRNATLWKSQLDASKWEGLCNSINLETVWNGRKHDMNLTFCRPDGNGEDGDELVDINSIDINWLFGFPPGEDDDDDEGVYGFPAFRDAHITCDRVGMLDQHALEPLLSVMNSSVELVYRSNSVTSSPGRAMLAILLSDDKSEAEALHHMWKTLGTMSDDFEVGIRTATAKLLRSTDGAEKILPKLMKTATGLDYLEIAFDLLGRGIDDSAIREVISSFNGIVELDGKMGIAILDASLRMCERGEPMEGALDLRHLLGFDGVSEVFERRPDLRARARSVARERKWSMKI